MWRQSITSCKTNPPFCVTAQDYTGKCLLCLAPLYEIDPANSLCRLIPCLSTQWRATNNVCQPNPANCVTAVDITGVCMVASPGFYVTNAGTLATCSSVDIRCSICRNGDGQCTTCQANYAWNANLGYCLRVCAATSGVNAANTGCYVCSSIDSRCNRCENFVLTCTACAPNYELITTNF